MALNTGVISCIYGAWCEIMPLDLQRGLCTLPPEGPLLARVRGRLRQKERGRERHLLAVGDLVHYQIDPHNPEHFVIQDRLDRKNHILRSNEREQHILGSNLDRAALVMSLAEPQLRPGMVDRFLCACFQGAVQPVLIFTKSDLYDFEADVLQFKQLQAVYQSLGLATFTTNLLQPTSAAVRQLMSMLDTGRSLLCGFSGTGKSTLLNLLLGQQVQKTATISKSTRKGRHTTTNSTLFLKSDSGAGIIDTPGVREWGLADLTKSDIWDCYPELARFLGQCRFRNCEHTEDSLDCAVQDFLDQSLQQWLASSATETCGSLRPGLQAGWMHPIRIKNLVQILNSLQG
ncbi:MAG: ribosome small subunit-dependent GTPase A [Leptospiraceae bacterium]|nr:ribosome small subunit-dependent GTPase A [Leptospiraceae bacterium]